MTLGSTPSRLQFCTWPWIDHGVTAESHSDGCGRVTGRGSTVVGGNDQKRPSCPASTSLRQACAITSRCSRKCARLVGDVHLALEPHGLEAGRAAADGELEAPGVHDVELRDAAGELEGMVVAQDHHRDAHADPLRALEDAYGELERVGHQVVVVEVVLDQPDDVVPEPVGHDRLLRDVLEQLRSLRAKARLWAPMKTANSTRRISHASRPGARVRFRRDAGRRRDRHPAPPSQVDDLRPLWLQLHAHHQSIAPELAPYLDDDESWRARRVLYVETLGGEGFALVARDGWGALVGYAMVAIHREEPNAWSDTWRVGQAVGEVETLLVVPEARGGGVGTRLLDAVDEELERRGIEDLVIGVVPGERGGHAPLRAARPAPGVHLPHALQRSLGAVGASGSAAARTRSTASAGSTPSAQRMSVVTARACPTSTETERLAPPATAADMRATAPRARDSASAGACSSSSSRPSARSARARSWRPAGTSSVIAGSTSTARTAARASTRTLRTA